MNIAALLRLAELHSRQQAEARVVASPRRKPAEPAKPSLPAMFADAVERHPGASEQFRRLVLGRRA